MPLSADGLLPLKYHIPMKLDHPNIRKPIEMIKYEETNYVDHMSVCCRVFAWPE